MAEDRSRKPSEKIGSQDIYLHELRKHHTLVDIYLTNGRVLRGKIQAFDVYSLIVLENDRQLLVFKGGIVSIAPRKKKADIFRTPTLRPRKGGKPFEPPKAEEQTAVSGEPGIDEVTPTE